MRHLRDLILSEDGTTATEYAVMLALIMLAIVGAIGSVGAGTGGMWGDINRDMASAGLGR
jgi:pilus assembly protein Flp/PilA